MRIAWRVFSNKSFGILDLLIAQDFPKEEV
jgi:hypothetical protein